MLPVFRPVLGVAGLPDHVGRLTPGHIYCVAADYRALRLQLLARSLQESLALGVHVLLVASADPWLAGLPALLPHRRSGRLRELAADELSHRLRAEPQSALEWISTQLPASGGLVLIDDAQALFELDDAAAAMLWASRWRPWAVIGKRVVLALVNARAVSARRDAAIEPPTRAFDGFALVRAGNRQASLEVRHWTDEAGMPGRHPTWLLRPDPRRDLVAKADRRGGHGDVKEHDRILVATRRAAADFPAGLPDWMVVDGWAAAVQLVRGARAGALVLHFQRPQDFRTLARAVAVVRTHAAAPLAVVVRETGGRLRIAQQIALLRLGASLIVTRGADATRVRLAAERFAVNVRSTRMPETDVERVISEADAAVTPGACLPSVFRHEAQRLLDGTDEELQHVLLRLEAVGDGVARLVDIATQRSRDALMCEHGHGLWLLLCGCAPEQVDGVLGRLFGKRFAGLFAQRTVHAQRDAIRRALAALPPDDGGSTSSPGAATSSAER